MLVSLWNAAMAAGGVAGGLLLDRLGAGALPWSVLRCSSRWWPS
ncbi:hypothetical protein STANM309S_00794 [Streptomyces tanashiensis]